MNTLFQLRCGCQHRGVGYQWEKCPKHKRKDEIETQMIIDLGEPKCSGCNADARRQKCLWDMGGFCSRFPEMEKWREELNKRMRNV